MTSQPSNVRFMRPIEEKQVQVKVELMVWSKKMDLLALSHENGEVALHRLNWLKVWSLPPPEGDITVKGIAWRPDGLVIAIGYSNKEIKLVNVETKEVITKMDVNGDITFMSWSDNQSDLDILSLITQSDMFNYFVPRLPDLSRNSEDHHKNATKCVENQKCTNLLFVGLKTGKLMISVFGLYPRVFVDVAAMLNLSECHIIDAGCSKDQSCILAVAMSGKNVHVATINTSNIFSPFQYQFVNLSYKFGHLLSCLDYMDATLRNIIEGWENIMMEMDIKLKDYASKVLPGKVSCDFMELLMFGTPSSEMSEFLLVGLTEKGLKKLNHSVELSYINIQGLVLKHLQAVGQSFAFHFESLLGHSRCPVYSQKMGLWESSIMAAFTATGSFLVKVAEVQHVIDESLKKYKAFFRWLYATFLRLNDERISGDICHMSQLELQQIFDFLSGFEDDGRFNLEQLGQYLKNASLDDPPPPAENWANLLKKHPSLANLPFVIQHNTSLSLVQEINQLRSLTLEVFNKCEKELEKHMTLNKSIELTMWQNDVDNIPKVTHSYLQSDSRIYVVITDSSRTEGYHFLEMYTNDQTPNRSFVATPHKVVDVQFYLPETLSILFNMNPQAEASAFALLPQSRNGENVSIRLIEGMTPSKFAVCGTRKVAVVLSESRRKVKVFELDNEEDDDEDGMDTTNSTMQSINEG